MMDDYNSPRTAANGNLAPTNADDLISFATPVIKSAHSDDNHNNDRYMVNTTSRPNYLLNSPPVTGNGNDNYDGQHQTTLHQQQTPLHSITSNQHHSSPLHHHQQMQQQHLHSHREDHYDHHNAKSVDDDDNISLQSEYERLREKYAEKIDCLAIMSAINERLVKALQDKDEENHQLIKEKEALAEEVAAIERSFGELHRRYEKIKSALETTKQSEEEWRNHYLDLEDKLSGLLQSGPRAGVHRKS